MEESMSEYCLMIDKRKKYLIGEGEVTKGYYNSYWKK